MTTLLAVVAGAWAASLILTPLVRRAAREVGLLDHPDGCRKLHDRPIPLGGGAAVLVSTAATLGVVFLVPNSWRDLLRANRNEMLVMLAAGSLIVLIGLADDRFTLRGRHKLFGQALAATILILGGLPIQEVALFGWSVKLGIFAFPFTLFWLLGAVNAINLLDGIDGLATILGIVLATTIAAMAAMTGNAPVAIVALALVGSLLGFLWYNRYPASIFLGDAGSMFIGLIVGALAIKGSLKSSGTVLLAAPLGIWAIPILDSTAAILRRKLTGRSIYATDRSHLHHRLTLLLGDNHKVLACVSMLCVATSAAALVSLFLKNDLIAMATVLGVVVMLAATGIFGRAEFSLLWARFRSLGRSMLSPFSGDTRTVHQYVVRLQGSCPWEDAWTRLVDSAEGLALSYLQLDVGLPAVYEDYHARWERPRLKDSEAGWRLRIPLIVNDRPAGSLVVVGQNHGPCTRQVEKVLRLLESLESQVVTIVAQEDPAGLTTDPMEE
jgi:UDP-GlcNAc:undecaprenyl-phosphate GlcNAc-1-phosphate transferase